MKLKLDRIISIATLAASVFAIVLVLKRPAPVAQPQGAAVEQRDPSSSQKTAQSEQQPAASPDSAVSKPQASQPQTAPAQASQLLPAQAPSAAQNSKSIPDVNSEAISAMLAKSLGAAANPALTPDSNVGTGEPNIKDQQVTYEGDVVHGRFLTEIGGKDVWVTISGHMGEKDGYATFDPTEFKVGDMEVPVSLVNPALQRKLAEERDRMKIPDNGPK
jgi:hypothetical protein